MLRMRSRLFPFFASASILLAACGGRDTAADDMQLDMGADAAADASAMTDAAAPMEMFMSTLTGEAERPAPVATRAQGEATFMVHADSISYVVNALDLNGVTAVHLHRGGTEEAGPVIVTLYTSEAGTDFPSGTVTSGAINRDTPLSEGVSFEELRELVRSGTAYINIHTKANPDGELRGQTTGSMP